MSPIVLGPGPSGPTFADSLRADLAPWLTPEEDPTGAHAAYLTALAQPFEQVFALVMDQGFPDEPDWVPGYGLLLDPDLCPTRWLPYLAQFVGASLPAGADDATARQIIREEAAWQRGTPGAMQSAALRHLTTSFLVFQERTAADGSPDAYHVVIGFHPADLLTTEQDLIDAVEAQKPGGIQVTYVSSAGFTWNEAVNTWSADTFSWLQSFFTQP